MQHQGKVEIRVVVAMNERAGHYIGEILESNRYIVYKVTDGNKCLEAFIRYHPKLIILEPNLRGLDGYAICRQIREQGDKTPILAVIDPARETDYEKMLAAGATDCFVTPISRVLMVQRVANLLRPSIIPVAAEPKRERPAEHNALGESEQKYRQLFNAANDAITIIDMQTHRFLDVNRQAVRWLGYTRDELLELTFDQVHVPLQEADQQMVEGELSTTGRLVYKQSYRRKDGREIPVEVSSRVIKFDGRPAFLNVARDITERQTMEQERHRYTEELEKRNETLRLEIEVRQHAEKAMSESEARSRALVEHAPEAIVVYDVNSQRFVEANGNALKLFEVSLGELSRAGITDFSPEIQPDGTPSKELMHQKLQEALDGQTPVFEWTYQTKSRRVVCEVRLLLLPTSGERLVRGSITDITERKRIQQAEIQQRFVQQALRESAAELSRTLELDEVFDRIIEHIQKVMPPHESASLMLFDPIRQMIRIERYQRDTPHKDDVPSHIELNQTSSLKWVRENRQPLAIPDTSDHPLWSSPMERTSWIKSYVAAPIMGDGSDAEVIGFIGLASPTPNTFNDDHASRLMIFANMAGIAIINARLYAEIRHSATELRRQEAESRVALENERVRLNAILNALRDGVLFTDVNWSTVYANRALSELTGYSLKELNSTTVFAQLMALPPDFVGTLQGMIMAELEDKGYWNYEAVVTRKDGTDFNGSLIATRVNSNSGSMLGTVIVLRDVSEAKRLEQQKSQFIANASHELRTPLANLKTRIYLARKRPDRIEEHLDVIETVTDRMRALVEALLDLSRFQHGQIPVEPQLTELQPLILEVARLQAPEAESRGQSLTHDLPGESLYAMADPLRFSQVITNLVTNAIHYTGENGKIRISLKRDGEQAVIGVHDNGKGIPPKILPNIFKPFVKGSEKSTGAGLGLAITREIVELHEGEISVESTPETGTTFYVRLALSPAPIGDPVPVSAHAKRPS